jgi:hypothetical protein
MRVTAWFSGFFFGVATFIGLAALAEIQIDLNLVYLCLSVGTLCLWMSAGSKQL